MLALPPSLQPLAMYIAAGIILLLTWFFAFLVGRLIGRITRRSAPQVAGAAQRAGSAIVWVAGGTLALQEVGISADVVILILGLLGVAVLIALRIPMESAGAKFLSDAYMPFKIGDSIRIVGVSGKVVEINAITTVLLAENDQLVSVPNAAFVREVVVNTTPGAWRELSIPISIASGVDLPTFESDLIKSLSKLKMRFDPRFPPVIATRSRSAQATDLTLTLMLRRPEEREALTLEVNQRVAETLQRARPRRS